MLNLMWQAEEAVVYSMCLVMAGLAPIISLLTKVFVTVPMGRHQSSNPIWGPGLPPTIAWVYMELPSLLCVPIFMMGDSRSSSVNKWLLVPFVIHYIYRALIYPFLKRSNRHVPLSIASLGMLTCMFNGYIQGHLLGSFMVYPSDWLSQPLTMAGLALWFTGFALGVHSELVLRNLRKDSKDTRYRVPTGALFKYVTSSNYLGELIEWLGYAIATQHAGSLAFFIYSCSYLGPRALSNHEWSKRTFGKAHPKNSKALIPFLL